MAEAESNSKKIQYLDINTLGLQELAQMKQQIEQEQGNIKESIKTLNVCKGKYNSAKETVESFRPDWQDREVLVPLTSSMYVPGRVKDVDNFVIDIGTGYYIEKNLEGTKDYFKRRVEFVAEQTDKIEKIYMQQNQVLGLINTAIQSKIPAQALQQKQSK